MRAIFSSSLLRTLISLFYFQSNGAHPDLLSFPTRRSSDLRDREIDRGVVDQRDKAGEPLQRQVTELAASGDLPLERLASLRSEEHTSELQSLTNLVCRLLLEKKNKKSTL